MVTQDEYEKWLAGADARAALQQRRIAREESPRAQRRKTRAENPGPLRRFSRAVGGAINRAVEDDQRGVPVRLDSERDTLTYQGHTESVRGVTAAVTVAGAVRARPTLTRFVAAGLMPGVPALAALAFWKDVDDRELYLVVDGPDWQWAIKADPKRSGNVRTLAAQINTAARRMESRS